MGFSSKKLATANLVLIAYYVLPNLAAFVLTLLLIGLTVSPQILISILQIEEKG